MTRTSSSGNRLPLYLKPGFWDQKCNQFWEDTTRNIRYGNKKKYRELVNIVDHE